MFAKGKWHPLTETTGMVSPKYASGLSMYITVVAI